MIVVVGRVRTDAERRASLIELGQKVAAASRAEAGCISYRLYQDTESADELVFIEEWESREALERHFATAHIAAFMSGVGTALVAPPDVKFHDIASSRDLTNVRG